MSFKTSSGETLLGATLVKDGRCLVPRGDMASKNTDSEIQVNAMLKLRHRFTDTDVCRRSATGAV
jgi:hypothetical protein